MKNQFFVFVIVLCSLQLQAQSEWEWARGWNSETGHASGSKIVADNYGYFYIIGYAEGTVNIGGIIVSTVNSTFYGKFDSEGNAIWINLTPGFFRNIVVNKIGDIFLIGRSLGSIILGDKSFPGAGSFVAKCKNNGIGLWLKHIEGEANINDIDLDRLGHPYITGSFIGRIVFSPSVDLITTAYRPFIDNDIFIAKYRSTGEIDWVKKGGSPGFDQGTSIAVDRLGNVFVGGNFNNTFELEGLRVAPSTIGNRNFFLAKMHLDGMNISWLKQSVDVSSFASCSLTSLETDDLGRVLVVGTFTSNVSFDGTSLNDSDAQSFVAMYKESGTLSWIKNSSSGIYRGSSSPLESCIGDDKIYLIGIIDYDKSTFDGVNLIEASRNGDMYVAAYSLSGNFLFVKHVKSLADPHDSEQWEEGLAIAFFNKELITLGSAIYIPEIGTTGVPFRITFDGLRVSFNDSTAYTAIMGLIGKLRHPALVSLTSTVTSDVYPNPVSESIMVSIPKGFITSATLSTKDGQEVYNKTEKSSSLQKLEIDVRTLKEGLYVLEVNTSAGNINRTIQVVH